MNCLSFKSKFGWISAFEDNNKIFKVKFGKHKSISTSKNLKRFRISLINFLNKKNITIKSNFHIEGNTIQKTVWKELTKIKLGKTKSYGEIAKIVKTSPRYVGNVCGQNRHLLVIPCHRVIRTDGGLGGFSSSGGIGLKKRLLNLEQ